MASTDTQIYLAYLDYRATLSKAGLALYLDFASFRQIAKRRLETINRWLYQGSK